MMASLQHLAVFAHYKTYFSTFNLLYFVLGWTIFHLDFQYKSDGTFKSVLMQRAPRVIFRNAALTFVVYSYWHHLLYVQKASTKKLNPKDPPLHQHWRDCFWTMVGTVVASLYEVSIGHLYAVGWINANRTIISQPLFSLLSFIICGFWADFHFYFAHRLLHPFFPKSHKVFDLGRFLYVHVHSLHHKSYNPGPWSGLAMHPIEHLIYFSRCLLVLALPMHPVFFLFLNFRAILGPAPGHHGYEDFFGSKFHYLHHAHSNCNYGTRGPLDRMFGTFRDK